MIQCLCALALIGSVFLPQHLAGAQAAKNIRVITLEHGVKLSLVMRGGVYPKYALIHARVALQNVSSHPIMVLGSDGAICAWYGPGIQVLGDSGEVLYPGVPHTFTTCGGLLLPRPLEPGAVLTRNLLLILRSGLVRGVVSLGTPEARVDVATQPLHLTLVPKASVRLQFRRSPVLEAIIIPSTPRPSGHLYVLQSCAGPFGSQVSFTWKAMPRPIRDAHGHYVIQPLCSPATEWHLTAGWLDGPVATVDYTQLRDTSGLLLSTQPTLRICERLMRRLQNTGLI